MPQAFFYGSHGVEIRPHSQCQIKVIFRNSKGFSQSYYYSAFNIAPEILRKQNLYDQVKGGIYDW